MSNNKADNKQVFFTPKRKAAAALCSVCAVILWSVLWIVFPMEFYSLFFASMIGSNLLLVLLSVIITFPLNWICSKVLSADVNMKWHLTVNIVGMVGCIYLYSIFRYNIPVLPILGMLLHLSASAVLYTKCRYAEVSHIKTKKQPLKAAVCGVISTLLADCLYLMIFTALLNIFKE